MKTPASSRNPRTRAGWPIPRKTFAILEANELHAEALSEETSLDTVYYSGKVPFGFNYAFAWPTSAPMTTPAWATAPTWPALWLETCRRKSRSSSTWRPWALPRRHS